MKGNINPHEVTKSISGDLKALDFKSLDGELSTESIENLQDELAKVQLMAFKAKLSIQITQLAKKSPELSTKIVLEKMLAFLPADITPEFLPVLAGHVVERWGDLTINKMAA